MLSYENINSNHIELAKELAEENNIEGIELDAYI
jgi:hypothetical protein